MVEVEVQHHKGTLLRHDLLQLHLEVCSVRQPGQRVVQGVVAITFAERLELGGAFLNPYLKRFAVP